MQLSGVGAKNVHEVTVASARPPQDRPGMLPGGFRIAIGSFRSRVGRTAGAGKVRLPNVGEASQIERVTLIIDPDEIATAYQVLKSARGSAGFAKQLAYGLLSHRVD